MYAKVAGQGFDITSNVHVAVRNSRYKLLHAFSDNLVSLWDLYGAGEGENNDDGDMTQYGDCGIVTAVQALSGTYTKFLFDLQEDPYEKVNLYNNDKYADIQVCITHHTMIYFCC
jgi:hypothetical protein